VGFGAGGSLFCQSKAFICESFIIVECGLMGEIAIAATERIIRKGSGLRVSESASKALAEFLEEEGVRISQQAALFAKHAKRKTITSEDIKLALKR
jgi:DNA-binding protein